LCTIFNKTFNLILMKTTTGPPEIWKLCRTIWTWDPDLHSIFFRVRTFCVTKIKCIKLYTRTAQNGKDVTVQLPSQFHPFVISLFICQWMTFLRFPFITVIHTTYILANQYLPTLKISMDWRSLIHRNVWIRSAAKRCWTLHCSWTAVCTCY